MAKKYYHLFSGLKNGIKKNSGKWDNLPDYGKFRSGFIGFQDHGSDLWFRNIKIKKL